MQDKNKKRKRKTENAKYWNALKGMGKLKDYLQTKSRNIQVGKKIPERIQWQAFKWAVGCCSPEINTSYLCLRKSMVVPQMI